MRIQFLVLFFIASFLQANAQEKPVVLVTYYSQGGHTKAMAESVAKGAETEMVEVILKEISEATLEDLDRAQAIIVGSPVHNANIAPAVQEFINSWPFEGRLLMNKVGAAFVSGGGISMGEELVMLNILHSMLIHGMVVMGGLEPEAAFGASAITGEGDFAGEPVNDIFLVKAEGLGKRVAKWVVELKGHISVKK